MTHLYEPLFILLRRFLLLICCFFFLFSSAVLLLPLFSDNASSSSFLRGWLAWFVVLRCCCGPFVFLVGRDPLLVNVLPFVFLITFEVSESFSICSSIVLLCFGLCCLCAPLVLRFCRSWLFFFVKTHTNCQSICFFI